MKRNVPIYIVHISGNEHAQAVIFLLLITDGLSFCASFQETKCFAKSNVNMGTISADYFRTLFHTTWRNAHVTSYLVSIRDEYIGYRMLQFRMKLA